MGGCYLRVEKAVAATLIMLALIFYSSVLFLWNGYDIDIFVNWVVAAKELGITSLYKAPEVFGERFRVVYPPLAPLIFVSNYMLAEYFAAKLVGVDNADAMYLVALALALVKLSLIGLSIYIGYVIYRRRGLVYAAVWLAGIPVLTVVFMYQFDLYAAALLYAALLLYEANRCRLATLLYTLSILVKPLTILVAPILALYMVQRYGLKASFKLALMSMFVSLAVVIPFILGGSGPKPLSKWTIEFHLERQPQGPTIATLYYQLVSRDLLIPTICLVALLLLTYYSFYKRLRRGGAGVEDVYRYSLLVFMVYMMLGKVVNPQYYVFPYILAVEIAVPHLIVLMNLAAFFIDAYFIYDFIAGLKIGSVYMPDEQRWYNVKLLVHLSSAPHTRESVEYLLNSPAAQMLADVFARYYHEFGYLFSIAHILVLLAASYVVVRRARA